VPYFVPETATVAYSIGLLLLSVTRPFTVAIFCALVFATKRKNKQKEKDKNFILKLNFVYGSGCIIFCV
jgi:hypothetical protein